MFNRSNRVNVEKKQLRFESLEDRRVLAAVTVDIANDVVDSAPFIDIPTLIANPGSDGKISLREAVNAANQTDDGTIDEITFDPSVFNTGTPQPILLTQGQLNITEAVTITSAVGGTGTLQDITIDAQNNFRIFSIAASQSLDTIRLEGLTLTRGGAFGLGAGGGAILFSGSGSTALNTTKLELFQTSITASTANNPSGRGGGIQVQAPSAQFNELALEIRESVISGNQARSRGGGIFSEANHLIIDDNTTITQNRVTTNPGYGGGGLYSNQTNATATVTITNTIISQNYADAIETNYAGAAIKSAGTVLIDRTTITGNEARDDVGGLLLVANGNTAVATIRDSTISDNKAFFEGGIDRIEGAAGAGLIVENGGTIKVESSTISGNVGSGTENDMEDDGDGGGLTLYGVGNGDAGTFEIVNSTISGNSTDGAGGGLAILREADPFSAEPDIDVTIRNTTIVNNTSDSDGDGNSWSPGGASGGGIFVDNRMTGTITLENTIVAKNFDVDSGTPVADDIYNLGAVAIAAKYNLIGNETGSSLVNEVDNLKGNAQAPLDPELGDLKNNGGITETHLPGCESPVLDAGDPNFDPDPNGTPNDSSDDILYDQRGSLFDRVYDIPTETGGPTGMSGPIDIGAVELSLPDLMALAADLNEDGIVDGQDLTIWMNALGTSAGGDIDGDGDTDGNDFLEWQRQYAMTSCHDWAADALAALQLGPNQLYVSSTLDEDDGNYSLGFLSLREAVKIANMLQVPTTILLPAGHYLLTLNGTEAGDASYNDLDITGDVTIVGDGAGFTSIDASGLPSSSLRIFDVASSARLDISQVTLTTGNGFGLGQGLAVQVASQGELVLTDSAVVNHDASGFAAIHGSASIVTIRRSVFTNNSSDYLTAAVNVSPWGGGATVTIGESIFAMNQGGAYGVPNVSVSSNVTKINEGNNLYDDASGGFFDTTPGVGDHLGTPDYVVTSAVDTFDHTDNDDALSVREAIDLANNATGTDEVWLPAWNFVLTRDRGTNVTDTDTSYGDIDISDSLIIRGVTSKTSIVWTPGVVDVVFDLLGDYSGVGTGTPDDGVVDVNDQMAFLTQYGQSGGTFSADGDDDGDVDFDDYWVMHNHWGNTLDVFDVTT